MIVIADAKTGKPMQPEQALAAMRALAEDPHADVADRTRARRFADQLEAQLRNQEQDGHATPSAPLGRAVRAAPRRREPRRARVVTLTDGPQGANDGDGADPPALREMLDVIESRGRAMSAWCARVRDRGGFALVEETLDLPRLRAAWLSVRDALSMRGAL